MLNKNILVLNCGSSSLKFTVLNVDGDVIMHGGAQKLGTPQAGVECWYKGESEVQSLGGDYTHSSALAYIMEWMALHNEIADSLVAVGHRVVHGGEVFAQATLLTSKHIQSIKNLSHLAPLHNPANVLGIEAALKVFPGLPHVAVFDTSFHQTLPERSYLYALPYTLYQNHKIRRYGFHGSSYAFVSKRAALLIGAPLDDSKIVIAHLGNGASVCAIKNGKSVDTSMGFTPLDGLVMGTRCGDLDPSIPGFIEEHLSLNQGEVASLLNKQSGLLGLSGVSNDFREIEAGCESGDEGCRRAVEVMAYRLAKYIVSYMVPLVGLDAIVFTGGIGENSAFLRAEVLKYLEFLGLILDAEVNMEMIDGAEGLIARSNSVQVLVVPTNEEWMIAQDVLSVLNNEVES